MKVKKERKWKMNVKKKNEWKMINIDDEIMVETLSWKEY